MSNIDQLITEQVLSWSKREFKHKQEMETLEDWPIITISRQYGARGRSLAKKLGELINFDVWDKALLTAIAEEAGADERFLASVDERRRKMIDDVMVGTLMGSRHSNTHYFRSLLRVVHTIAAHGKSIIVGRGSNYIVKSPHSLRVRLVCPDEQRIAYVAEHEGILDKEAQKLIRARDAEREDFIRFYFKRDPGQPQDFDLVLNSGSFSINQMSEIVLYAYEQKIGKKVPLVAQMGV